MTTTGISAIDAGRSFGMDAISKLSNVSTINYNDFITIDKTSKENEAIKSMERDLYAVNPGKVVVSNRSAYKTNAIIVSEDGITLTSSDMVNGLSVKNSNVNIQGVTYFSGKGTTIRKGEFSENPKSSNQFTYRETVVSVPKELANIVEKYLPKGTEGFLSDVVPIITDISAGPLPHYHTISMKHVHRIDPAYLYRVPQSIDIVKGSMGALGSFFSEKVIESNKLIGTLG